MSNEVVEKQQNLPATSQAWEESGVFVGSQDLVIAKILPMQGLSDLVAEGKARMGEFRDSLSGELIADIDQKFEFVPFHVEKFWDVNTEDGKGNYKWTRTEPLIENPAQPGYNDNLKWEDTENGAKIRRVRRMNFYGMLASQVAKGESIPYILSFKSTSFKEGKKLFTQMYMRNRRANLAPCAYVVSIKGVKRENDKGKFVVPTIEVTRKSTQEEIQECFNWFQLVRKGAVKVDESDVVKAADLTADEGDTGEF